MNDKLIRVGAVAMIGVIVAVGYSLMQRSGASQGPAVHIPVTANALAATKTPEDVARDLSMPLAPQDKAAPVQLGTPDGQVAGMTPTSIDLPADVTAPMNAVPGFDMAALGIPEMPTMGVSAVEMTATDLQPIDECEPLMRVDVSKGAVLRLLLSAPCNAGESIEVAHGGLRYTAIIDGSGGHMSAIPALTQEATITVTLADGTLLSDTQTARDVVNFRRIALVGETMLDLELHALELGAGYGDAGHVHLGNRGNADIEAGGKLTILGDSDVAQPVFAQVYSVPLGAARGDAMPELSVEAVVSEANCGLDRSALTLMSTQGSVTELPVEMALPGCEAIGEMVILSGIFTPAAG